MQVQHVQRWEVMQEMREAERFPRADDVGRILDVDRSTVYRMAESGRLSALKVGRQWRFPADQIAWLFDVIEVSPQSAATRKALELTAMAVLPNLELRAELLGVMMVVTDIAGEPVTDIINPCPWFRQHADDPSVLTECLTDWKQLVEGPDFTLSFIPSRLAWTAYALSCGLVRSSAACSRSVGGIAASDDDPHELYRLDDDGRAEVLATLPSMAARVSLLAAQNLFGNDKRSA